MTRRVLLLEDDLDIALISVAALRAAGIDVAEAHSLAEAYDAFSGERPNLAVVDLQLPDGSGWELVRWAREHHPAMRVLICSVHADEATNASEASRLHVDGILPKTGDPDELTATVSALLDA